MDFKEQVIHVAMKKDLLLPSKNSCPRSKLQGEIKTYVSEYFTETGRLRIHFNPVLMIPHGFSSTRYFFDLADWPGNQN